MPLSDEQILEDNAAYFDYIEHRLGCEAAENARREYLMYAREKKVVLDPGSRLGVVRVPRQTPLSAIAREKELKKWRRDWKIRLIEEDNPDWRDLSPALIT